MKHIFIIYLLTIAIASYASDDLWNKFFEPSNETRTKVWWFHGETETTEEGIEADLEAFQKAGIGGVVFYDQVHGNAQGAFDAMSPQWWKTLKYAASKAQELNLSFEVAASNGYVAGGPWITPDLAMQKLTVVDTMIIVESPQTFCIDLSHPDPYFRQIATLVIPDSIGFSEYYFQPLSCTLQNNEEAIVTFNSEIPIEARAISYQVNPRGKGSTGSMNIPGEPREHYFGALYDELPPIGSLEYSLDGKKWQKVTDLPAIESVIGHKSRQRTVSFPKVYGKWFRVRLHNWMDDNGKFNNLTIEKICLSTRDLIDNWQVKSGMRTEVSYPHPEGESRGAFNKTDIRDATQQTDENGILRISLEPGCWHILRFGHIPTYARTKHGRKNLIGYEADVMSAEAASLQFNNYFKAICDTIIASGSKVAGLSMDSHEAGIQNWTSGFERIFEKRNGYQLNSWLPALVGYIISDRKESEHFLKDFRQTVAETIATEFYGTFARLCQENDVTFTSQAMLNIINDNILSRSKADKPQGEFWAYQTDGNYDCLDAASSAHLYGRPIASAEAFTDTPYSTTWNELRRIANLAYCRGINEFAVCAASFQPWLDHKYNDSKSAHPYVFHRLNPQWTSVQPFWEYQARCSSLLREGEPVVDLCIFLGEDFPAKTYAYKLPLIPEGYNFDICTRDALINRFSTNEGELVVKGGMKYKALIVQDRSYISSEALQKIEELVEAGLPVIRCDKGEDVSQRLNDFGILPDVSSKQSDNDFCKKIANKTYGRICFFHRETPSVDIYFLYNHNSKPFDGYVTFRSHHTEAELWDPVSVSRKSIPLNTDKSTGIFLEPFESVFIVIQSPN